MHKFTLAIIFILFVISSSAQEKTYSGTVRDADNSSELSGVSVMIMDKTSQTITDDHGEFSIEAAPGDTMVFTFIGMETQKVALGDRIVLDILLHPTIGSLDEVTVVAFGEQKKSSVVGSISTVNAKDLRIPPLTSLPPLRGESPE